MSKEKIHCYECNKIITKNNFESHIGSKSCEKNKRDSITDKFLTLINEGFVCTKCNKEFKTIGAFRNHYWIKHHHMEDCGWKPSGFRDEIFLKYMQTDEYKKEQSQRMLNIVKNNPNSYSSNNVCGRVKIIEFNGEQFHGTWEIEVAKYLIANKITYIRNVTPIEYIWEGKTHLYFPDFYIPSLDKYIEVKGYERPKDRAKWLKVKNLIILKEKDINTIKRGEKLCL